MGAEPRTNGPFTEEFEQRNERFFRNPDQTNKVMKLLWIGVGSNDQTVGKSITNPKAGRG
jgi:hypothetical protein